MPKGRGAKLRKHLANIPAMDQLRCERSGSKKDDNETYNGPKCMGYRICCTRGPWTCCVCRKLALQKVRHFLFINLSATTVPLAWAVVRLAFLFIQLLPRGLFRPRGCLPVSVGEFLLRHLMMSKFWFAATTLHTLECVCLSVLHFGTICGPLPRICCSVIPVHSSSWREMPMFTSLRSWMPPGSGVVNLSCALLFALF